MDEVHDGPRAETQQATDGYPIHVAVWPASAEGTVRGRVVVIHGVQSHSGWYHKLGRTLSSAGYEVHFLDRRGSGVNQRDRGDTPSARRLIEDVAERLQALRDLDPALPQVLAAISWGGKTAAITAADYPRLVDGLALICPGFRPRVGVRLGERLRIAFAFFTNRRKRFPIPLSDPALFTAQPEGRQFIASDPLSLRQATAGLLAASTFIDRMVAKALPRVRQPALLMLAGQDRIVDNEKTREDFAKIPSADKVVINYPEGHHTLEFEPDPSRYANHLVAWMNRVTRADPVAGSVQS